MANPRRAIALQIHTQAPPIPAAAASSSSSLPSSLLNFLKRPASFPFLLSLFVLLTWISLRFHQPAPTSTASLRGPTVAFDPQANLVRYPAALHPTPIAADARGWLLDPVAAAHDAGLPGGALVCLKLHVGLIPPGGLRGNHRHHTCNETFVIWGAKTKFRLENADIKDKGYGEAMIAADEVAVVASAKSTAHALINMDVRPTFFLGCQDTPVNPNSSNTDYKVWKDL
ncbi:uncharacterized protein LOC100824167 [Brachypodium distachyon]|uniref:Uncharacterized protein n=1 Tax=Brachypodium distachyon TaxID=15368 RepID=I1HSN6_BRADI|nr:uncharacterized protein LOC100824167 [Brachypodium distachyon]KQK10248.1 hypothetical protein BRADI_2g52930v3 [Brachypodium distachyon]|eukprot:XP_003564446.1 uncharacterized protein LOC100824167 [Brachypodium distachyon]